MKKRGVVVKTYTDRVIEKLISSDGHHKKVGCWYEGKFYAAWADQSKSRIREDKRINVMALANTLLIEEKQ